MDEEDKACVEKWEEIQRSLELEDWFQQHHVSPSIPRETIKPPSTILKAKEDEIEGYLCKKAKLKRDLKDVQLKALEASRPKLEAHELKSMQIKYWQYEMSQLEQEIREASLEAFRWKKTQENLQGRLKAVELEKKKIEREQTQVSECVKARIKSIESLKKEFEASNQRITYSIRMSKDLRWKGITVLEQLRDENDKLRHIITVTDAIQRHLNEEESRDDPEMTKLNSELTEANAKIEVLEDQNFILRDDWQRSHSYHKDLFQYNMAQLDGILDHLSFEKSQKEKTFSNVQVQTDPILSTDEQIRNVCLHIVLEMCEMAVLQN